MIRELEKGRMASYLPPHYRESEIMSVLLAAQEQEIDELYRALEEILDQFFITSATWGLHLHEEGLGLPVNRDMPVDKRRQRVLAKHRGVSKPLLIILRAIAPALDVRWGRGVIPFILSIDSNIGDYNFGLLVPTLEIYKPAGKAYSFTLKTPDNTSGYTIYGEHSGVGRGKVAFLPIVGTIRAGRWPLLHTTGQLEIGSLISQTMVRTGIYVFPRVGTQASGAAPFEATAVVFSRVLYSVAGLAAVKCIFKRCGDLYAGEEVS